MILTFGQEDIIIVTLYEKRTLTVGYYLFVFTHYTTKETVTMIYNFTDDESDYSTRYNKFTITTSTVFSGKTLGQWVYKVYEQASGVNTNPAGLTELESGIMTLKPADGSVFDEYSESTTYKVYEG